MLSTGVKYHLFAGAVSKLTLLQAKFRNGWYVTIHASLRFFVMPADAALEMPLEMAHVFVEGINASQSYWKELLILVFWLKLSKKIYIWHNCIVSYKLLPANTCWHTKPTQCAIFLDLLFNVKSMKALDSHIPKKKSCKYDDIQSGLSKFSYCSHTVLFYTTSPRFTQQDKCLYLQVLCCKSVLSANNPKEYFTHPLIIFHCPHTLLIVACGYL